MKILLYAFEPFGEDLHNISKEVLLSLPNDVKFEKVILPTTFNRDVYTSFLQKNPEMIIGLGQYPRGKKIRIERKAANEFSSKKMANDKIILRNQPKFLHATLMLSPTKHSRISYNAGKYVCNFSMFIILHACKNTKIKYAFLHIPKNMNIKMATKEVLKMIQTIKPL